MKYLLILIVLSTNAYGVECRKIRNPEYVFYYPGNYCPMGSTEILYT